MDYIAPCLRCDLGCYNLPLGFVFQIFNLDELVVFKDLIDIGNCGLSDVVSSNLDSGFEAVGLFLKAAYLSGGEGVHAEFRIPRFLNWFPFRVVNEAGERESIVTFTILNKDFPEICGLEHDMSKGILLEYLSCARILYLVWIV